ncbi:LysR family transcriptional regulator [Nocardioides sp.]|uniref:LysR family transcriptional regulator n=1 Tax=Nocardioides sp. TaxID=35761 RepID=UPI0031FE90CF|nr:LysR family transcriptional regulator [Nocardioides sp.]
MELRHLEYFVAVAEERSFTAAAARLHVVQSAVSAGVKALERELGSRLLDRTPRRVDLTDAGATLLPRAQATLDAARDARDAVEEVRGGLRGTVRVGTMTSVGLLDVPGVLGEFHRRHPGVLLRLSAAPSGSMGLVDALVERRLDLAFVSLPGHPPPGVQLTELARTPMVLVVPVDHPLADRNRVPITDLADLDFIDSPVGYGNRSVADRAFEEAGVRRRVSIEITDVATAPAYIRHGLGIALLPRFAVGEDDAVVALRVAGADLDWPMSLATPGDRTPSRATAALLDLVLATLREPHDLNPSRDLSDDSEPGAPSREP